MIQKPRLIPLKPHHDVDLRLPNKWGKTHHVTHIGCGGPSKLLDMDAIVEYVFMYCEACGCAWRTVHTTTSYALYSGVVESMFKKDAVMEQMIGFAGGVYCDPKIVARYLKNQDSKRRKAYASTRLKD